MEKLHGKLIRYIINNYGVKPNCLESNNLHLLYSFCLSLLMCDVKEIRHYRILIDNNENSETNGNHP